jgi:hypothetical protein
MEKGTPMEQPRTLFVTTRPSPAQGLEFPSSDAEMTQMEQDWARRVGLEDAPFRMGAGAKTVTDTYTKDGTDEARDVESPDELPGHTYYETETHNGKDKTRDAQSPD